MRPKAAPLALILPLTTIVGAAVAGALVGIEVSLLVIAGGALVGVIALIWASVQSLTGESPITLEEALSLGAPSAEEEQKRAVLRALKDLEYERSVGKITQEDYAELSNRYRMEARRLIHYLDMTGEKERDAIEQLLSERLATAEAKAAKAARAKKEQERDADRELDDQPESEPEASAAAPESKPAPGSERKPEPREEKTSEPVATPKTAEGEGA